MGEDGPYACSPERWVLVCFAVPGNEPLDIQLALQRCVPGWLCHQSGRVPEGCGASFFLVKDSELYPEAPECGPFV